LAKAEPINGHSPMQDVIATHEPHQGDLFFLPAGRLHAIGAGNFLTEIQQTSDITYRVYDFGRKDANGVPRKLHLEQAKEAIDYQVWPEYRTSYDSTKPNSELIHCPYFIVNRVVVQVAAEINLHSDSFVIVVCLWGEANINGIRVKQGETLLVPASENVLYIFGNATFLTATM
jgi:mannose-6-phosphate isomerase